MQVKLLHETSGEKLIEALREVLETLRNEDMDIEYSTSVGYETNPTERVVDVFSATVWTTEEKMVGFFKKRLERVRGRFKFNIDRVERFTDHRIINLRPQIGRVEDYGPYGGSVIFHEINGDDERFGGVERYVERFIKLLNEKLGYTPDAQPESA